MKDLYIVKLFRNLFRLKNVFGFVYLTLLLQLINFYFYMISQNFKFSVWASTIAVLLAFICAISPLGEKMLRKKYGCERITDPEILNRLEPLFMEVKERAMQKHVDFQPDENIHLYIKESADTNAFALGRRTICVTTGLLDLSDDEIKAVLGHEFGHLALHDTEMLMFISSGSYSLTIITSISQFFVLLVNGMMNVVGMFVGGQEGFLCKGLSWIVTVMKFLMIDAIILIYTKIGLLLIMKTSRDAEYEADAFTCDLGYQDGLLTFFQNCVQSEARYTVKNTNDLYAALTSSHPKTEKRIKMVQKRIG